MRAIATDVARSDVVCLSVCLSVCHTATETEHIEMPFADKLDCGGAAPG